MNALTPINWNEPSPELTEGVCQFVRAGGYPHVAAIAQGVPAEVWWSWMARAATEPPTGPCRRLRDAVDQAHA